MQRNAQTGTETSPRCYVDMSPAKATRFRDLTEALEPLIGPKGVQRGYRQRAFCFSVDNTQHTL
eukprot:493028-Karenia_brevis.AAC.1